MQKQRLLVLLQTFCNSHTFILRLCILFRERESYILYIYIFILSFSVLMSCHDFDKRKKWVWKLWLFYTLSEAFANSSSTFWGVRWLHKPHRKYFLRYRQSCLFHFRYVLTLKRSNFHFWENTFCFNWQRKKKGSACFPQWEAKKKKKMSQLPECHLDALYQLLH